MSGEYMIAPKPSDGSFSMRQVCILVAMLASAAGCDRATSRYDSQVTGTVTLDGELATRGMVQFHPVGGGPIATGLIQPDGSYSVRTGQGDLAEPDGGSIASGDYQVTVVVNQKSRTDELIGGEEGGPPKPGVRLSAAKYANRDTTDLRRTVKPGPNVIVLEIERATPEESAEASEGKTSATPSELAEPTEAPGDVTEPPTDPQQESPQQEPESDPEQETLQEDLQ